MVATRRSSKNNTKEQRPTLLGRTSKNATKRQQPPARKQGPRKNKNDAGAWPEYAHMFDNSLTQESSIMKKELFKARNRWGRDVSFCVDSTPIDVDVMPAEEPDAADKSPAGITLVDVGAEDQEKVPRRITMDGTEHGGVQNTPPPPAQKKTAPPPPQSTIVRNPYAKRYKKKPRPPPSPIPKAPPPCRH